MDIKLLKADILSNKIPNFLIFEDHEYGLCKQYINYIKSTKNLPLCYCSADEAIYNIETNIKNNEQIFIIYNDAEVLNNKDKLDKIANYDKYIIIYFDIEIDEKSYLYKNYNINIV